MVRSEVHKVPEKNKQNNHHKSKDKENKLYLFYITFFKDKVIIYLEEELVNTVIRSIKNNLYILIQQKQ